MNASFTIRSLGTQWEYSWTDELGYHQYYCEKIGNVEKIIDFNKREIEKNKFIYSWNDELGYHQYLCEL
jgi:hypothetical protein